MKIPRSEREQVVPNGVLRCGINHLGRQVMFRTAKQQIAHRYDQTKTDDKIQDGQQRFSLLKTQQQKMVYVVGDADAPARNQQQCEFAHRGKAPLLPIDQEKTAQVKGTESNMDKRTASLQHKG